MYHAIVRARLRAVWRQVEAGDHSAAVRTAAPELRFRFVGPPPLGADLTGPEAFSGWFDLLRRTFPGIRLSLEDVVVGGPPWRTRAALRLRVEAPLPDGDSYRNEALQWITLRWGRMTEDLVLEDAAVLAAALERQARLPVEE